MLTLLDDCDPVQADIYNRHFYAGTMTPAVMAATKGNIAPWMASLTFGGPDLSHRLPGQSDGYHDSVFHAPLAGLPMSHWSATGLGLVKMSARIHG